MKLTIRFFIIGKEISSTLTSLTMNLLQESCKKENVEGEISERIADRKEILFDGYFYDVTDFIKRHPGGSVITYYTKRGEDATHAIQQFHHRSINKVNAMMSSLKKRPASDTESDLVI